MSAPNVLVSLLVAEATGDVDTGEAFAAATTNNGAASSSLTVPLQPYTATGLHRCQALRMTSRGPRRKGQQCESPALSGSRLCAPHLFAAKRLRKRVGSGQPLTRSLYTGRPRRGRGRPPTGYVADLGSFAGETYRTSVGPSFSTPPARVGRELEKIRGLGGC